MEKQVLLQELLTSTKPSELDFIQIPEITRLQYVPQNLEFHPEGNAWIHSMEVLDRAAKLRDDIPVDNRLVYMLAAWLHDIGKWNYTFYKSKDKKLTHWTENQPKDAKIVAYGHDFQSAILAKEILKKIFLNPNDEKIEVVTKLIAHHMKPLLFKNSNLRAFKRLEKKVNLFLIGMLSWADRGEKPEYWFNRIEELKSEKKWK